MPAIHTFRPQRLALAITLSLTCAEYSMAQQQAPQVIAEAPPAVEAPARKPRQRNPKPDNDRLAFKASDDLLGIKQFIGPQKQSPPTQAPAVQPVANQPSPSVIIEFDEAFFDFAATSGPPQNHSATLALDAPPSMVSTPLPTEPPADPSHEYTSEAAPGTSAAPASDDSLFDTFKNAPTTQQTRVSELLKNAEALTVSMGDGDDLLIFDQSMRWQGSIDGGGGNNALHLDATDGGTVAKMTRFDGLRVEKGHWTLTDSYHFPVGVEVLSDAVLNNEGDIQSHVHVDPRGAYAGSGKVDHLTVEGILAINALRAPLVRGDLTLTETAAVIYEITPRINAAPMVVQGTATLNDASLQVVAGPGEYEQSTTRTVLSAQKIEGTFGEVTSNLAFMTPSLNHYETSVELTYARNDVPIEAMASSENDKQFARSISEPSPRAEPDRLDTLNAAVTALLDANHETVATAIEQMAGAGTANLAKATLNSDAPISAGMLSAMGQSDQPSDHAAEGKGNGRVWVKALGHGGKLDRKFDALQHSTHGLLLGADWRLDEQWRLGLAGSKSATRLNSRGLDGDLDSWHLGAYALRQSGPMSVRLGAAFGNHEGTTKRQVTFNGFSDRPKGRYEATTQQAFAEVGYNVGGSQVSIEPYASLGFQRYQRDSYTEKGGAAALQVQGQTRNNANSTLGLRVAQLHVLENGLQLAPRINTGWKHTYGEVDSHTRQKLAIAGNEFTVEGAALDRDTLMVDAGVDVSLSARHTLGVGVIGEFGTDSRNHGVTGQWRMNF